MHGRREGADPSNDARDVHHGVLSAVRALRGTPLLDPLVLVLLENQIGTAFAMTKAELSRLVAPPSALLRFAHLRHLPFIMGFIGRCFVGISVAVCNPVPGGDVPGANPVEHDAHPVERGMITTPSGRSRRRRAA